MRSRTKLMPAVVLFGLLAAGLAAAATPQQQARELLRQTGSRGGPAERYGRRRRRLALLSA